MPKDVSLPHKQLTIADLYPDLTPEQQAEAEFYLNRYIAIVRRIFERTQNLTGPAETPKI